MVTEQDRKLAKQLAKGLTWLNNEGRDAARMLREELWKEMEENGTELADYEGEALSWLTDIFEDKAL